MVVIFFGQFEWDFETDKSFKEKLASITTDYCAKNRTKCALKESSRQKWVETFTYFTHISNFNISGTNTGLVFACLRAVFKKVLGLRNRRQVSCNQTIKHRVTYRLLESTAVRSSVCSGAIQRPNLPFFGDVFNYFVYQIETTNLKQMTVKSSWTDEIYGQQRNWITPDDFSWKWRGMWTQV